ncbi:RmlC-like cupin [Aspergillus homomorphus CBS 101889]|uniref:RmlC-like cupin n=1 Tax=Aspergillus homomorphus (strain CBS 101889) TaxID=1450537 RepID=A0A395I3I9_ASPHC|nr:RmlC-like cupin [Aspergillus homomorphus CBS 101889]RAL14276.1 RmlC-like cupin [Aspergillus homomorphus CBS 101889]
MSLTWTNEPPKGRVPYAIPQLEGERITIPGSKGSFRILASSLQTNGLMSVFQSGAVLSDAPGFHYHNHAHDVFLVTKGFLKLWNGDKCRIMGPGDFAYVPPTVIHNPEMMGPHTETYGVVTPGDWVDFFRYVSEPYDGVLVPENDNRDLKSILIPKVMAAKEQFDVVFQPHYQPPELGEWTKDEEVLPEGPQGYFLRANTGPKWIFGGVMSRPFVTTTQSSGVCAISSIESSKVYSDTILSKYMTFKSVDHCLCVQEGTLIVSLEGQSDTEFREGETAVIPAGQAFALKFASRFVRVWSFTDGDGIETLIQRVGQKYEGAVLPDEAREWDAADVKSVAAELNARPSPAPQAPGDYHLPLPRAKRPRAAQACDRCRSKKYKCDEQYPCSHCKTTDRGRAADLPDLERKVDELTAKLRLVESETTSQPPSQRVQIATTTTTFASPGAQPVPQAAIDATPVSLPRNESTPREDAPALYDHHDEAGDSVEDEISELNHHTNGIEFHGSTSSAALLGHLQKAREPQRRHEERHLQQQHTRGAEKPGYSIVSTLHNSSFSPSCSAGPAQQPVMQEQNYYFEQAHAFINGYFENIHFIHPLIDKEDFLQRAHHLWFNRSVQPEPSFVALYLSILSFGALVRVWDEERLGGLTRFEWSRKLFGEAQMYLNYLNFSNTLDTVQCLYLMAKICQNELNPNMAYMYLGLAIRTCLAAGFNREVRSTDDHRAGWISKTWWGLFSLEIEMSFSVGRPDTLGMDEYHNRALPERDDSEYAIIPWMVDFAQIIRRVSVQIYHSRITLQEKLHIALQIETDLDRWMARLPDRIKPDMLERATGGALRDPKWARRQRLVLGIRYFNVKMLLFRPFLSHFTRKLRHPPMELEQTIAKCLDAAMKTIEVIYDIYRIHEFFRCWWYNTTYVMFATSTLLLPMSKLGPCPETVPLQRSVEMGVEILEAMDESIVARKSVEIIKHYLREFRSLPSSTSSLSHLHQQQSLASSTSSHDGGGGSGSGGGGNGSGGEYTDTSPSGTGFDIPEWAYGFGFPDCSFEGIARLFDDLGGLPMLDN